jgi:hypothetical protein
MAKIVVGSPSLTQPLLLYPGLGPAMLNNIGGVTEDPIHINRNTDSKRQVSSTPQNCFKSCR